jgi:hypothetical protein
VGRRPIGGAAGKWRVAGAGGGWGSSLGGSGETPEEEKKRMPMNTEGHDSILRVRSAIVVRTTPRASLNITS